MSINVRTNDKIKGIKIQNEIYKICQLADDTTLFLKDIQSVTESIAILTKFEKCSGLRLNISKSEIIPIGQNKSQSTRLPKDVKKLKINTGAFKTLGVWFANNDQEAVKLNFDNRIQSMGNILNMWESRNLSWKGKVVILKSLVIPQVTHLMSLCYCPDYILEKIDKLLFDFLWSKKTAKVKRGTITANFDSGGLRMPDIYSIQDNAKIRWIQRLLADTECSKWKILTWYMLDIEKYLINRKISPSYCRKCYSKFHMQMLESWQTLKNRPPENPPEILNEYIFNNVYICSNRVPLDYKNLKVPTDIAKNIKVNDFTTVNREILTYNQISRTFDWNISMFSYNIIVSAIPQSWKAKIKGCMENVGIDNSNTIQIKGKSSNLVKVNSKSVYWELLSSKTKLPTSIELWIDLFPFMEAAPWNIIFKSIHNTLLPPYMQTFQYKIVNRILNCRYNLYKWKLKDTPFCIYCKHFDTLEHHLFLCAHSKEFWEQFEKWVSKYLTQGFHLTICEVLFGKNIQENDKVKKVINVLISYGKWYVNFCRTNKKRLSFFEFLRLCKSKVETSKYLEDLTIERAQNNIFDIFDSIRFDISLIDLT